MTVRAGAVADFNGWMPAGPRFHPKKGTFAGHSLFSARNPWV
jgi:hypothetical protein